MDDRSMPTEESAGCSLKEAPAPKKSVLCLSDRDWMLIQKTGIQAQHIQQRLSAGLTTQEMLDGVRVSHEEFLAMHEMMTRLARYHTLESPHHSESNSDQ